MVSSRLKDVIFKKLYSDLSHLEIIECEREIWFIDREKKLWYFIYNTNGAMWWKYSFFRSFFEFFSVTDRSKFDHILSFWVEDVLKYKVTTTKQSPLKLSEKVEDVLKYKVNRSFEWSGHPPVNVNVVLNNTEKYDK